MVWRKLHRFSGPPHRIINVYGIHGSGKSFLGWLMGRERYATYGSWSNPPKATAPRLVLDNSRTDRASTRDIRPLVDRQGISQIILLSRQRVDEPAMPAFELAVSAEDVEQMRANFYRYLDIIIPEGEYGNYSEAVKEVLTR